MVILPLLLFLLSFLKFSYSKNLIDCHDLFKNHAKPHECCYYPFLYITNTSANACTTKCSTQKDDLCCLYDCSAKKLKIYANDEFLSENLIKLYETNIRNEWEMSLEKWIPKLKENIERCQKIVPPKKISNEPCETPFYTMMILNCITKLNFLNCPTFTHSKDCDELYEFIKKLTECGERINGHYLIHMDYFAPTDDNKDSDGIREV